MKYHQFDIDVNAERNALIVAVPLKKNKEVGDCGYRIAGPKAWGGYSNIARFHITETPLVNFVKKYAPDVLEALKNGETYIKDGLNFRFKLFKHKKTEQTKLIIEHSETKEHFFFSGDKNVIEKESKMYSASFRSNDLLTYINSYCAPKATQRIIL